MLRASRRSVFTIIAESAAFTCRGSSSTASNPAPVRPACRSYGARAAVGHTRVWTSLANHEGDVPCQSIPGSTRLPPILIIR